jgi:hypothetical protein
VTLVEGHRGEIIYSTEASPRPARISQIERGSLLTIFGQLGLNRFLMGRRKGRNAQIAVIAKRVSNCSMRLTALLPQALLSSFGSIALDK